MADLVEVMITVGGAEQVSRVADALREADVEVSAVLEEIGAITARCPADRVPFIERIPGVSGVERQRTIKLPPVGSPQ